MSGVKYWGPAPWWPCPTEPYSAWERLNYSHDDSIYEALTCACCHYSPFDALRFGGRPADRCCELQLQPFPDPL
jgi:hypothetical protein